MTINQIIKLDEMTTRYLNKLALSGDLDLLLYGVQMLNAKYGWRLTAEHDPVGKRINIFNVDLLPNKSVFMAAEILKFIEPVALDGLQPHEVKALADNDECQLLSGNELWDYFITKSDNVPASNQKFFDLLKFCGFQQKLLKINKNSKRCYAVKLIDDYKADLTIEQLITKNGFGTTNLILQINY